MAGPAEKPDNPVGTWVSVGCYGFPASTLSQLPAYLDGGLNRDQIGWFLQWLVDREEIRAFQFDDPWFDVGSREPYLDAVSWALDGQAFVADSASVSDSTLDGASAVGADAVVERATLEGTVVFPGASIRDAEIRHSVIGPDTTVADQQVAGALLASNAER